MVRCQKELRLARSIYSRASGICRADPGGAFGVTRKVVVLRVGLVTSALLLPVGSAPDKRRQRTSSQLYVTVPCR